MAKRLMTTAELDAARQEQLAMLERSYSRSSQPRWLKRRMPELKEPETPEKYFGPLFVEVA